MPLVAAALLAYVCGLLIAGEQASVAMLGAAALVVWTGGRRTAERIGLAALAASGIAAGVSTRDAWARCERRLLAADRAPFTLDGDAKAGAFIRARHACGVSVRIAVRSGSADAGATVLARGTPTRGRTGLIFANANVSSIARPGTLPRIRSALGRRIDAHFGTDAPLVRALLIADMEGLSPSVRTRFASAGLSHMLSVSGLHVGLIAAAMLMLVQMARMSRRSGEVVVVVVSALYVLTIGAPLPAVRSAIMLGAVSLSVAAQRPTSPWAVLAVGAISPVLDAAAIHDIGYQLSVAGMVALVASGALPKRWPWLAVGGWQGTLMRGLVTSMAATLITAPLVGATFGRISLVAPVSNLVAVPVMAVLQPMLFLAAVLLPFPSAAQFVADACHPLLAFIDAVASAAAQLPGASVPVSPDGTSTVLATSAAVAIVVACVSRHAGRPLLLAAACCAGLVWRPLLPASAAMTEVHMIDVGQGDAVAVRTTRGRWLLFDAGREWEGGDAGARDVLPYLTERGGTLEAFVLSHPHSDHVGGAASVIRALEPRWYFDPAYVGAAGAYRTSLSAAQAAGSRWRRATPGDSLVVDEVVMTVLAPAAGWADSLSDPNEASLVVRVRVGEVAILMMGDAEAGEERWLVENAAPSLRADVLKVAHHGSRTSSTPAFLDAVRPRLALISVGAGNMYRHPSPEVLRGLAASGAVTLRTDYSGAIVVRTDGHVIEVETRGERWALPPG
jgi:competence protein ComEC